MLLPYSTDARSTQLPVTAAALVLANFVVFGVVAAVTLARGPDIPTQWFAVLSLVPSSPRIYAFLTYCLLHEDVFHLSANMLFVWVFGGPVEEASGWKRFLALYGLAAIGSGIAQAAAARVSGPAAAEMPIIGASGAAAAMVGAFAVRYYRASIRFVGLPVQLPAAALLAGAVGAEAIGATVQMLRPSSMAGGGWVAHAGHVAGFITGVFWARALKMASQGKIAYLRSDAAKDAEEGAPMHALRRWEELLAKRPNDAQALAEIALIWADAGDREQCAAYTAHAMAEWMRAGDRLAAANHFAAVEDRIHTDLGLTRDEMLFVAFGLEETGRYEDAVRLLQRASSEGAPDTAALRACALLLRRIRAPERAAAALREFLDRYPASDWKQYATDMLCEAELQMRDKGQKPQG